MTGNRDDELIHRELNTDRGVPAVAIAEGVADFEGTRVSELTPTCDCIDGMIAESYPNPPSPEAQITVEFTYRGYRSTVERSGAAQFVRAAYAGCITGQVNDSVVWPGWAPNPRSPHVPGPRLGGATGRTRTLPRRHRTESPNPMSAALCPAKPPGLTRSYRDETL